MSKLNYMCENNISDSDCNKCLIYGVIYSCLPDCPDFKDSRLRMTPEMLKERDRLIKMLASGKEQNDNT